ncbi:M15 family metallopeptidase [Nocardia transvalensis]|uniref:M15 family metallopeptidase n=1 Tax=Nocardia transvalensis TaxID=37333 RepID=UPI0018939DB9|nr:M15 family metallopeptidase [Nocardia transvalensis]MBF6328089.1 M15 family metallopeptidase [Nocardia transvalensis]
MNHSEPARTTARRIRSTILAALAVVSVPLIGVLVYHSLASLSSSAAWPFDAPHGDRHGPPGAPDRETRSRVTVADGAVPDGVTVFDDEIPAVANLDPDLLGALRRAATDAADYGVEFVVNSGWRSPEYQEQLLREAVSKYGSKTEAARWVATPDTSVHVSGAAVDIGPSRAAAWLSKHGAEYGLCQIYNNEPWHYELRPEASDYGCPPRYADPTQDPRMQQ